MKTSFLICFVIIVSLSESLKQRKAFNVKKDCDNQGSRFFCTLLGLCAVTPALSHYGRDKFSIVHQWSFLEFQYDSTYQRNADLQSGNLIPNKPAPIDMDVYYNKYNGQRTVFVTVPRFQKGVPASLGTVVINNRKPYVKPYPSWEWFKDPARCKPNRIVSVYRIMIDECDRLWVLDNGQLDADVICPPQVLAFDLRTNQLIHKYEIPTTMYTAQSTFVTPIVDIISKENGCRNTFLYLADCVANNIIVYDVVKRKSWKIHHYTMYPNPDYAIYDISGETFTLMDGVLGMSLSPRNAKEGRKLFYHAMSSGTEHWIYTKDLQNEESASNADIIHSYKGSRGTQCPAEAIDSQGIMYQGLVSEINIACFNTRGEYGRNCSSMDIVADNKQTLQFASGIKVIKDPSGREFVWVLTSRFQKVSNDDIKETEINFRIQAASAEELKMGTKCQLQSGPTTYPSGPNSGAIVFPGAKKK